MKSISPIAAALSSMMITIRWWVYQGYITTWSTSLVSKGFDTISSSSGTQQWAIWYPLLVWGVVAKVCNVWKHVWKLVVGMPDTTFRNGWWGKRAHVISYPTLRFRCWVVVWTNTKCYTFLGGMWELSEMTPLNVDFRHTGTHITVMDSRTPALTFSHEARAQQKTVIRFQQYQLTQTNISD